MAAGMKCPACGLMQMARPTCKSCGSPLGGPAERPSPLQPPQQEFARFKGAQIENQDPEERPQGVKTAVNLFWASMALGLVDVLLDFAHISARIAEAAEAKAPVVFISIMVLVVGFAFSAFLIAKISAGRNWARIVFLILFAIGMLDALPEIYAEFTRAPFIGALSLLQVGMLVYGVFLVFTQPGSVWFRKYKFA
jgi:phosphoglycerol transferase MdoB-like AlkP superfamily enzyme